MPLDRGDIPWLLLVLSGAAYIIVGLAGELLGWWGDLGLIIIGSGIPQLLLGFVLGAGRRQVDRLSTDVRHVGTDVRQVGGDVRQVGQDVREVAREVKEMRRDHGGKFDVIIALLTDIRDRMPPPR